MASWVRYLNFAAASGAIVTALLGLMLTLTMPYVERWERRFFGVLFSVLGVYTVSDFGGQASQYFLGTDYLWLSRTFVFLELLFAITILPLLTVYLLRCAGKDWARSGVFWAALGLEAAYVVVTVVAQFSDAILYFSTEERCVLPGPWYPVIAAPPVLLMLLDLGLLVRYRSLLSRRQRRAFSIYFVVPLLSVFLQAVFFGASVLVIGISFSALVFLGFALADQTDAHVRQREREAQRRAEITALQMRPHFIYNVMSSIYYLCEQDVTRAQQVTLDFTTYLRANFDAVAANGEVPFAKELEHTRAYLAVEQARFEGSLVVEIDCPHTNFKLPPLTLQPLVENAVKHGVDPERPPLHVRVATREEPDAWVVEVLDDGPGIEDMLPAEENRASALTNIQERLAARGASLSVEPREAGGTAATIRIPKLAV